MGQGSLGPIPPPIGQIPTMGMGNIPPPMGGQQAKIPYPPTEKKEWKWLKLDKCLKIIININSNLWYHKIYEYICNIMHYFFSIRFKNLKVYQWKRIKFIKYAFSVFENFNKNNILKENKRKLSYHCDFLKLFCIWTYW